MQQINLYLPELQPKKEWLTANSLVLSVAGVFCLMILFSVMGKLNLRQLRANVVQMENQQVVSRSQVDAIRSKTKPINIGMLDEQIQNLQMAIKSREEVGKIIEYQNLGNAEGFSKGMTQLAVHSPASIAIEHFVFSDGGRYLEMSGKTREPQEIALFIEALSAEPEFNDTRFGLLSVAGTETPGNIYAFSLGFKSVYTIADQDKSSN